MSIITVNGQQVDVGDDYDKMSPEEQKATQEDIANQLGLHEQAAQDKVDTEQLNSAPPSGAMDMSNPNSTARQVFDPLVTYGAMPFQAIGEHPALAAGAAGLYKANQFANAYMDRSKLEAASKAKVAETQAQTAKQNVELQRERIAERTARPVTPQTAPGEYSGRPGFGFQPTPTQTPPSGPVASAGPVSPQAAPQMGSATPAQGAPRPVMPQGAPTAPVAQQAAPTAENFLQRMTQMAKQYAPAASEYAGSVGKVVAPIARFMGSAPVLGAQLMAHSGELNTNEDRLLAEKHALEQRMLQNKHDAEWSKYVDAKIKGLGQ